MDCARIKLGFGLVLDYHRIDVGLGLTVDQCWIIIGLDIQVWSNQPFFRSTKLSMRRKSPDANLSDGRLTHHHQSADRSVPDEAQSEGAVDEEHHRGCNLDR